MQFFFKVLLTSWIDPFLWFKSLSTLGVRRSKNQCILIFLIYCCLIDAKVIIETYRECNIVKECLMILVLLYVIWATWFLFKGTLHEKAIYIFMFYCILIITELGITGGYALLFPNHIDEVLSNSLSNLICGAVVKVLQGVLCYCFFRCKKAMKFFYQNRERLSLILLCIVILSNLYMGKYVHEENFNILVLFETALLLLVWFVLSALFALKEKNRHISKLKYEANSNLGTPREVSDIDQFKHDFSTNVFIMKNLLYYKNYEKLKHYMENVSIDVEEVELQFEHPNFPVKIIMSNLIQIATKAGIPFSARIETDKFGMTDEDTCIVLHNLVLNGLDLASVIELKKHVFS